MRGGGGPPIENFELGTAAGGLIKQCILEDTNSPSIWQRERTICFNVQVLNSDAFRQVTGMEPPGTPISATTYASQGLPFYKIYNETSNVKGDFGGIKSVKTLDKTKAGTKRGRKQDDEQDDEPPYKNPVILLSPNDGKVDFPPVSELVKELASMKNVQF